MHGQTVLLYAMSFASAEHPNIVLLEIFKFFVVLETVSLQWSDHVNFESTDLSSYKYWISMK